MRARAPICWLAVSMGGLWAASPADAQESCPLPTVPQGSACVLNADVSIGETIELGSFTSLDCRGHAILPSVPGSGTPTSNYVASTPEAAILISGTFGVNVRHCVLGQEDMRFDFGILAINSKSPGPDGHRIAGNEIHAREAGVTLLRVDDARINDNVITWTNGSGIRVRRNSDRNRVMNNVLTSAGAPPAASRVVPGGSFFPTGDDGIVLGPLPLHVLYNLVVDGHVYQFPNFEDGWYPANEDNLVAGNAVSLPGSSAGKSHAGILIVSNEYRARVVHNTVTDAGMGIRLAGLRIAQPVMRVSQCMSPQGATLDRLCGTDGDCFIPEVDSEPLGTCPTLVEDTADLHADSTIVERNVLVGPFNSPLEERRAAIVGGNGTMNGTIRGNEIYGTGIEAGISLGVNTLASGTITDNRIHQAALGFLLMGGEASHFGACIYSNDITESVARAIGISGGYALPSELSCRGIGNYWGHKRPPCFAPSDSPDPSLITDSHAFCRPVAARAKK